MQTYNKILLLKNAVFVYDVEFDFRVTYLGVNAFIIVCRACVKFM